jgi:hypothetical protein
VAKQAVKVNYFYLTETLTKGNGKMIKHQVTVASYPKQNVT